MSFWFKHGTVTWTFEVWLLCPSSIHIRSYLYIVIVVLWLAAFCDRLFLEKKKELFRQVRRNTWWMAYWRSSKKDGTVSTIEVVPKSNQQQLHTHQHIKKNIIIHYKNIFQECFQHFSNCLIVFQSKTSDETKVQETGQVFKGGCIANGNPRRVRKSVSFCPTDDAWALRWQFLPLWMDFLGVFESKNLKTFSLKPLVLRLKKKAKKNEIERDLYVIPWMSSLLNVLSVQLG